MGIYKTHKYQVSIEWTGNRGSGTSHYQEYDREHIIKIDQKIFINGSSDPSF